jgi:tetratricopeptide (TPR) repeat protein
MSLWRVGKTDCLLIGTKGPHEMRYRVLKERLANKGIADDLKRIDITNTTEFLLHKGMGVGGATAFSQSGRIHTDDNALVEFSSPRSLGRTAFQLPLLEAMELHRETDLDILIPGSDDPALAVELEAVKKKSRQFIEARGQVFRAYIYHHSDQPEKASAAMRKAAQLNPADTLLKEFNAADHSRAFNLARSGQMEKAIALYQTMIQRVPGDERAHYNLAHAYRKTGNLAAALHHYQEAIRWKADYTIAVYNAGRVSDQMGDLATAEKYYRRALALNPELILALDSLARLMAYRYRGDGQNPAEAVQFAEKANRLTGNKDPYLLETLGMAYEADDRPNEARGVFKQALGFARTSADKRMMKRLAKRLENIRAE